MMNFQVKKCVNSVQNESTLFVGLVEKQIQNITFDRLEMPYQI